MDVRQLSFRLLQVYIRVVQLGNISAAARALHLTQPTVSLQLKKLAELVKEPLLQSTPAGLQPTAAGQALYQAACDVLSRFDDLNSELNELGSGRHGHASFGLRHGCGCSRCCRGGRSSGWCGCSGGRCSAGHGRGVDAGDQLVSGDGCTVGLDELHQHASGGRGDFEHDLVGFDFDQDFIGNNGLACFFLPRQHGGFGHGFGQLRDFDFYDSHINSFGNGVLF